MQIYKCIRKLMNETQKELNISSQKACENIAIVRNVGMSRGKSPNRILPTASPMMLEKDTNATKDWTRFAQWVHCMCVVTFDLNLGQALEFVYPPQFVPTDQEVSNICYMAFPDSNSGCMGDNKFHMRFRIAPSTAAGRQEHLRNAQRVYNDECVPVLRADQSHFWGFVYFRQKRDANLPRGYFQKSFIIITRLPFFNLFYDVLSQLAPKYFNEGNALLEEACAEINSRWPPLEAGVALQLPLFEQRYHIHLPKASSSSRKSNQASAGGTALATTTTNQGHEGGGELDVLRAATELPPKVIVSVNELELFHSLSFVVDDLYTLWELVLISEPIVVVGTSPADCSHMVQSLVALISPLGYCAEARPYFTIHDTEFKEFVRECGKVPPSVILGVTNPFFVKLLKEWPHMLRLVDNQLNMQQQAQLFQKNAQNSNSVTSLGSVVAGAVGGGSNSLLAHKKASTTATGAAASPSISSGLSSLSSDGASPGLFTKYKPFLKKDKPLIKKVLHGMKTKRPGHVQTALLRRHLLELTQSFMIPLERYIASLMPLQKDISPFKSAPNANAFKLDDFLATLELSGPQLTSPLKGDWKGLYRRFFNSANFRGWYESRHRELQLTLQELQLQALFEANLEQWAKDKQEVEIIDMILKLKQKLNLYGDAAPSAGAAETGAEVSNNSNTAAVGWSGTNNGNSGATRDQIRAQINCMKELLPHDLKNVVNL